MGYSLTSAPPGTDPLPHRLEAHSMVFNYIDMLGVAAAAAGYGSVKEMPRPFQAQADAESRKVLTLIFRDLPGRAGRHRGATPSG